MRGRGYLLVVAMVCWGCSDRSTPADGSPPEVGVELGLPDKGLADLPSADGAAADLAAADAGAATFVGNRSEDPCVGVINVCKGMVAGCTLDGQHYVRGSFPGTRKFVVTAAAGKKIRILVYLESKLSPGTETELDWFEPGCTDEKTLKLSAAGTDLFTAAGSDDTFIAEQVMKVSGDHLVKIWSDAVAKFLLRADVVN
jgi:hypothetical protein